jgi:chromosome segregation ATPase
MAQKPADAGKTESFDMTYKGSVTPKATKYLKSEALSMDFQSSIELDSTDASNLKTIQKEFQSEMEDRIKGQLDHLNKWLAEKDQTIADMVKRYEEVKKAGFPDTPQAASQRNKTMKELNAIANSIRQLGSEYTGIVKDWAENCREQQGRIAMQVAVKSARVKTFDNKTFRVRAGQVVKGVLIVLAIAASVAAIIVSAGATAPLFIGLAAAGATIAGVSNLSQMGKIIVENANMEKRVLGNVQKDVEAIQAAFGGVKDKNSSLAKHVTELRNLMKVRQDSILKLENDMMPQKAASKSYATDIAKLSGDPTVEPSEIAKKQKAATAVSAKLEEMEGKIKSLKADNAKAQEMLKGLTDLNLDLDKFSGQSANTMLGNLKERFSKLEGWTDLGNTVGGLVNSASGIHH